jgi:uncharacterized protein
VSQVDLPPGVLAGDPQALDEEECRRLLGTAELGRLALTAGALPAIVPVPFTVHGSRVLIPTRSGSALVLAVRGAVVAFAVDSYHPGVPGGWGVNVVGPARVVTDPAEIAELASLRLFPAMPGADPCFISVQMGLLRGWRVEVARLV